ncbi:hypothetical protein GLOIN_2v1627023, partial [Rhizophagus irregularis DAOM 181602=DAOM 197198]
MVYTNLYPWPFSFFLLLAYLTFYIIFLSSCHISFIYYSLVFWKHICNQYNQFFFISL